MNTAVARIFCISRKGDAKLQILVVSKVTLLIKDFAVRIDPQNAVVTADFITIGRFWAAFVFLHIQADSKLSISLLAGSLK